MTRGRFSEVLVGTALAAAAAGCLALTVRWTRPPYEDAAMLLRYAVHVAAGHGMVWNIGDPPLDGATDLLFTLAVAATIRLGVPVHLAARLLGVGAHVFTVLLVYIVPRRLYRAPAIVCALGALFLSLGPAKSYIGAEFGTTFFAAWVALAWAVALIAAETRSRRAEWALPILGVLLGMARPEGAILGVSFLIAVAVYRGGADGTRLAMRSMVIFAAFGTVYFAARWRYFGHPLPNPFYVKGNGHIFVDSLRASVGNLIRLAGPFLPLLALGLHARETTRRLALVSGPVAIFIGAWVLLSNEMNFNMRFQYAVLPMLLMTWPGVILPWQRQLTSVWRMQAIRPRAVLLLAGAMMVVLVGVRQHFRSTGDAPIDGRREVGERLASYQPRHYTLAVSEAGLLPFYSGWRAIDAWGLNDAEIAQTGGVTIEYLDRSRPAVISFHAYFSDAAPPPAGSGDRHLGRWDTMTMTLYDYANARGYRLAACFGLTPDDTHFYFVRPDLPDAQRLIDDIRSTPYAFAGGVATDFARRDVP
jgi:arabinofuranosyltransferase